MGGVIDWCVGFLFQKVEKFVVIVVDGGFFFIQIVSFSGYVQIDWKRGEKDVNKVKRYLRNE